MKKVLRGSKRAVKRVFGTKKGRWLLAVILLVVVVVGGGLVWHSRQQKQEQAKKDTVLTYSPDKPDETKPDKNTYKWYGQPNDPKYITLSSIGAEGFLQKVGVDQNKQVATPGNINMAGWFVETARPGQKGLSIIDGHVNGYVNAGIFKNLIKLKTGDTYTVEFGDGSTKSFKVHKVQSVKTADAASVLFSQDPAITNQLNLITCGGTYNRSAHEYEERVIVISEAV